MDREYWFRIHMYNPEDRLTLLQGQIVTTVLTKNKRCILKASYLS